MKKFRHAVRDGRRIQRTAGAGTLAALKGAALARAAGHVVAKRTALGLVAMADATWADQAKFARMVPEKMEAFGASAMTFLCDVPANWRSRRLDLRRPRWQSRPPQPQIWLDVEHPQRPSPFRADLPPHGLPGHSLDRLPSVLWRCARMEPS